MKNLSWRIILIIWLVPILLVAGLFLYFGLNLGVEYSSANVVDFQLKKDEPALGVEEFLKSIKNFSRLDILDENRYIVYYQNVDLKDLDAVKESLIEQFGEMGSFNIYIYNPTTLQFMIERILYAVYAFIVTYLIAVAYQLKGSKITRGNLIWFLLTEVLVIIFNITFLFGLLNTFSLLISKIGSTEILFAFTILIFSMLFNLFFTKDLVLNETEQIMGEFEKTASYYKKHYLAYFLLFGILLILVLFVKIQLIAFAIPLLISLVYSEFLFIKLRPILFDWLISHTYKHSVLANSKFFKKEW